jgi:GNAT superfamily N-acetyltransferase
MKDIELTFHNTVPKWPDDPLIPILALSVGNPIQEKLKSIVVAYTEEPDRQLISVWNRDVPVGIIGVRMGADNNTILHLSVVVTHRGMGIGRALVRQVIRKSPKELVAVTDLNGVGFYKALGFQMESAPPNHGRTRFSCKLLPE